MNDKDDPNKKHYFSVATHAEFCESMLIHCTNKNSPSLTIWEKGDTEDDAEIYGVISYVTETKQIKLVPTGKLITKITGSTKAGKAVLVKIPISEKVHFFTGGLLKFHPEDITYTLEIGQEIYKSQARSNFRLNASETIPVQFKIDEQVFDALDISASGTSFLIDLIDKERFQKGSKFPDCTLRFDRKNYHIPFAVVAVCVPYVNEAGKTTERFKVGIAFKEVPQKTEDELYIKISTEARGEEMKKKFDIILSKKAN